jgi:hypothetical protein
MFTLTVLVGVLLAGMWSPVAATEQAAGHAPAQAAPGTVSADWILGKLAQPVPVRTAFVELRESRMLKNPLRLSGEYRRPAEDVLVREVRVPYAETTTIVSNKAGGEATIERAGKPPRTFPLSRAPELAGLQASFGALLSGDRAALGEYYAVRSGGTRERWTLTLTPRAASISATSASSTPRSTEPASRLRDITLYGQGAELRCIETRMTNEPAPQRTLLASAAHAAAGVDDAAGLAALCHDGVPAR